MTENALGYEKISKLLKNFAVPSIVASLVGSIYNIVGYSLQVLLSLSLGERVINPCFSNAAIVRTILLGWT